MPRQAKERPIVCDFFVWHLRRRNGVFYADGRGRGHNLGKQSLGTRDHTQAMARLRQLDLQMAIDRGLTIARPASDARISIAKGWELFLAHSGRSEVLGGVSSSTLKRYRAVRDHHLAFCRSQSLTEWAAFDKAAVDSYSKLLCKRAAYRTQYFELTLLKSVNSWLIANDYLSAAQKLVYPLRKPQGTDTYCYSRAELAAMIKHCSTTKGLNWLADLIVVLAHTGLRISEAANLRWSDVSLANNSIQIADERSNRQRQGMSKSRTTKGRRSRKIPIHPHLRKMIVALPRASDGYVLHAPQGGILRPRNVLEVFIREVIVPLTKTFPTTSGDIGFEHGRLHSFRHFFCSQAFLGGASEGEIKEWLGHKEAGMVEHYRHLRNEDAQRKMAQINFLDTPSIGDGAEALG